MSAPANESVIYIYSEPVNPAAPRPGVNAAIAVMSSAPGSSPAVRICCELSEILTPAPDFQCTREQSSTEDPVTTELLNMTQAWETVWTGFPACANEAYEWRLSDRPFTVSEATLHLPGPQTYDFGEFCIGKTIQDEDYVFVALTCQKKDWQSTFYTILLINSIIFLALTLFHHVKNKWSLFTRLHNWLQVGYLVMTLAACACLAAFGVLKVLAPQLQASEMDVVCISLGYALDVTFISAFCWLTALNLDLWLVFGCKLPTATGTATLPATLKPATATINAGAVKKVAVLVTGGVLLPILFTWQKEHFEFPQSLFEDNVNGDRWTAENETGSETLQAWPSFGVAHIQVAQTNGLGSSCTSVTNFPYLYPPIAILLLVNIIFHIATLISARKRKAAPTPLPFSSTCNAKHWTMLALFVKLFGLTVGLWALSFGHWALVTFAAATAASHGNYEQRAWSWPWLGILANSVTHSQGIIVFVMYAWTGNMYRRVRGKFIVLASRMPKSVRGAGAVGGGARLESVSASERARPAITAAAAAAATAISVPVSRISS